MEKPKQRTVIVRCRQPELQEAVEKLNDENYRVHNVVVIDTSIPRNVLLIAEYVDLSLPEGSVLG